MVGGILQLILGQRVAEVNDAGDQPATAGTGLQPRGFVYLTLTQLTPELGRIAVQFSQEIRPDARPQMEVIHILRDEETQFTQILQFNDSPMTRIGFD
jgi:hypothetical protein